VPQAASVSRWDGLWLWCALAEALRWYSRTLDLFCRGPVVRVTFWTHIIVQRVIREKPLISLIAFLTFYDSETFHLSG
jgi:hypothetical protein